MLESEVWDLARADFCLFNPLPNTKFSIVPNWKSLQTKFQTVMKLKHYLLIGQETLWEKEEIVRDEQFSHNVFQCRLQQTGQMLLLFGKGLRGQCNMSDGRKQPSCCTWTIKQMKKSMESHVCSKMALPVVGNPSRGNVVVVVFLFGFLFLLKEINATG